MLFRTLCGGHWRFCVVTAFLIVVYICRRGLVPGLGHPRILASDFTSGRRTPPAADLGSSESHTAWTAVPYYYGLGHLVLARASW